MSAILETSSSLEYWMEGQRWLPQTGMDYSPLTCLIQIQKITTLIKPMLEKGNQPLSMQAFQGFYS